MSAGATQHLQGLVARKSAGAEPATHAQYFNHVADLVRVNDDLTSLRTHNLKRRRQVAYFGYEAVLNRKKRSTIRTTTNVDAATLLLGRVGTGTISAPTSTTAPPPAPYISPFQAATTANATATANAVAAAAARPQLAAMKAPKPILAAPAATPHVAPPMIGFAPKPAVQPAPAPALTSAAASRGVTALAPAATTAAVSKPQAVMATSIAPPVIAHAHAHAQAQAQAQARAQQAQLQAQAVLAKAQSTQAIQQAMPKRSDFTVGTPVLIRHTADLVACGARNLAGKTGRIVSAPQLYGQELYSVYIDDHETVFQVPFNALTLIRPSAPTMAHQHLSGMKSNQALIPGVVPSPQMNNQGGMRPGPTLEQIKMEHSVQLHRLMQQQYREIQVLQQRYAECRLVNPAALTSIQNELSKLRLVHLSQVQTLKSKQALDLLGK